jgi:hypothetical protein
MKLGTNDGERMTSGTCRYESLSTNRLEIWGVGGEPQKLMTDEKRQIFEPRILPQSESHRSLHS